MKKVSIALALALLAVINFTACTTVTNSDGTTSKVVDPAVLQAIAQDATAVGGSLYLQSNPSARPQFELARTSVKALLAAGNGSPADLQAALASLPVKQIQGNQGAIIVSSAVTLIDLAGRELKSADQKQVYANYVQPIAQGIANGLDQVLGQ